MSVRSGPNEIERKAEVLRVVLQIRAEVHRGGLPIGVPAGVAPVVPARGVRLARTGQLVAVVAGVADD